LCSSTIATTYLLQKIFSDKMLSATKEVYQSSQNYKNTQGYIYIEVGVIHPNNSGMVLP
jgi:hypothetical protein